MSNTVRMASQDRSKGRRRVWLLSGVVAALLAAVLLLTLGRSAVESYAREQVVTQARANGIVLHLTTADVSSTAIHLGRANVELEGVRGVTASFASAEIALERLSATQITIEEMVIRATGEPLALLHAMDDWQNKYAKPGQPNALPKPALRKTKFIWSPAAQLPPFVTIEDLVLTHDDRVGASARSMSVAGSRAEVGAYVLQPLALALQLEPDAIEVGFGTTQMATAAVRGGWKRVPGADDFHVVFGALPIGLLLERFGLRSQDPKLAAASGAGGISLRVPQDTKLAYVGQLNLDLIGWTPPHPPELDGFAFGNTTKVASMLEIDRALTRVRLPGLKVTAGPLQLSGQGLVDVVALSYAQIKAELKGQLPCAAIAASMAESKLGKAYGRWVAQNANRTVEGYVGVTVLVDADTRHMDKAKVLKQIGVGCGLRPLTLREALSLGLPPPPDADLLRHVAQSLPKIEIKVPGLPQLPSVPSVTLPDKHR